MEMDKDLYYSLVIDKYLDVDGLSDEQLALLKEAEEYFIEKSKQNMGIGMLCAGYVFVKENQDLWAEYGKVQNFLEDYISVFASKKGKSKQDFNLEFINYGRTELVYVLLDKKTNEKVTILAKQPIVEYGKVKEEVDNLKRLIKVDKNVIAPIDYFSNGEQELYVTPYINQARCVASDRKWGMYIPEPFYRFEYFTDEQEHIVNSCMIAKLVSLYDFENGKGIGKCKLGGGDFMLPKGWEEKTPTIQNTIDGLYLISAREMLRVSFEEYLDILRREFSISTIDEEQDRLLINVRGRVAMKKEDIENGIKLGCDIIYSKVEEKGQ